MRIVRSLCGAAALLVCVGCGGDPGSTTGGRAAPGEAPDVDVMRKWSRSCALCHVDGNAGAPRVGNPAEWRERLSWGKDALLVHTIEGYNDMPPLGYCMACERDDFVAMIEFMTAAAESGESRP